ncbi:fructosamine kinase family protein [Luteimonas sp. SJ-92]|uniref:Fructosamine kinase family protein n=1 Tax=Luteimonas salinisoli TaxID=2752307 RepID=A0A853J7M7_9GAMM|nr:fructosamine kinase family protein [Luteimonas salinisoli]NZA25101.1 fructosamine kinase family protein [Luteimonas salinisoli]
MEMTLRARLDALGDGVHRLRLADGRAVVAKRRCAAPPGFFAVEAHGLALLRDAHALRVPDVAAVAEDALVVADLGRGRPDRSAWERAGAALARQHARIGDRFGLDRDGWCGDSAQANTPMDDGWRFFAECRLLPQARRALDAGRLGAGDVASIERLCAGLPARVPAQPPALLHGDLWSGNLHACGDGELALIDAGAVHFGWAEAELAMLTLFGEPPEPFFAAYHEAAAVDQGWRGRAPLYNLYHLLNHLNLFGSAYLAAVRGALRPLR